MTVTIDGVAVERFLEEQIARDLPSGVGEPARVVIFFVAAMAWHEFRHAAPAGPWAGPNTVPWLTAGAVARICDIAGRMHRPEVVHPVMPGRAHHDQVRRALHQALERAVFLFEDHQKRAAAGA